MDPEESFKIVEKQEVTPISNIDLRQLSEIYDEQDIYLSIYIPTASKDKMDISSSYLTSRLRAIRKALPKDLAQSFESTMDLIGERLEWKPERRRQHRGWCSGALNNHHPLFSGSNWNGTYLVSAQKPLKKERREHRGAQSTQRFFLFFKL